MLTRLNENGHAKCAKYWPDETMSEFYGQLIVESMAELDHGEYVERTLKLTHQRTKKTRDGLFISKSSKFDRVLVEHIDKTFL